MLCYGCLRLCLLGGWIASLPRRFPRVVLILNDIDGNLVGLAVGRSAIRTSQKRFYLVSTNAYQALCMIAVFLVVGSSSNYRK